MLGTTLGPYRIDAELGSGGMGSVYRATTIRSAAGLEAGAVVALKLLHAHLLAVPGFFERFHREAEVGKRVIHENVVRTLDAGELVVDGARRQMIVMEYVEGETLRELLGELGRVPEELCRHIGREVAKGLCAIHAAGVVHRDVKPENVIIARRAAEERDPLAGRPAAPSPGSHGQAPRADEHVVKLMDLGVARLADEAARLSRSGVFAGSIHYAAPEQFERGGADVDGRADLYALGLVLYELATASNPNQADDVPSTLRRVLHATPRRAGEVNPQISPFFEEVVHTLLAKRREERFASAKELAGVLEEGEGSAWWRARATAIRATTRRPLRRIRVPRETAVRGRDAELARLRALYDKAKAGEGQVLLVEGEAGIGKSRLIDEFVGQLQGEGEDLNFLFGSYPPGGAATASGAFTTAYREQFGGEGCAPWLAATPVLVPAFDALLRGEPPPAGTEPLTKESLQTVFVHATRSLAAERPTIVLIDDLHFAPEAGRSLFAALAMAVAGHRILLVGTARPDVDEKWLASLEHVGAARLSLARLGAMDVAKLLIDVLKSERTAEDLALKVLVKSDGNPFFVFEILRGLRDGKFIARREDGTWVSTGVIGEIRLPTSVQELVQARVADLSQDERDLLDVAACAGFEFDPALLAEAVAKPRIPVLKALSQVERAHRLVRSAGRRFVFDHHQVQEALYGSLPEMLREEYHAAIGDAMERLAGPAAERPGSGDGGLFVGLAEHFLRGARPERALRHLDAAMTHLERVSSSDDAVRLADLALSVPGLLDGRGRCELLLRKSGRLSLLGRAEEERRTADEAVSLADAAGDPALRGRAWNALGSHLQAVSRFAEAEAALGVAIEAAREAGDRRAQARATGNLGVTLWRVGRLEEAHAMHQRNLALAQEAGDVAGAAVATGNVGVVCFSLGRFEEAGAWHARCLALSREIGDRRGEAAAAGNLATVLWALGRYAEARTQYEQLLPRLREIGFRRGEAITLHNLGDLLARLGRGADADECLERALALARETGVRHLEAATLRTLGDAAARRGEDDRAEQFLRTARDAFGALAVRDDEAGAALRSLGALLSRRSRIGEALACLEESAEIADAAGLSDLRAATLAELARLGAREPAAAILVLTGAEARIDVYTRMETRFLLWASTNDRAHIAEARRLLALLAEHAPADCRESMLANVRLHREIVAAAKAVGL